MRIKRKKEIRIFTGVFRFLSSKSRWSPLLTSKFLSPFVTLQMSSLTPSVLLSLSPPTSHPPPQLPSPRLPSPPFLFRRIPPSAFNFHLFDLTFAVNLCFIFVPLLNDLSEFFFLLCELICKFAFQPFDNLKRLFLVKKIHPLSFFGLAQFP